jgi:hypothetical protein
VSRPLRGYRRLAARIVAEHPGDARFAYHAPRYAFLLRLLDRHLTASGGRVLDIGRSDLTDLLAERFQVAVDSLGFETDGPTSTGRHYHFDLNRAQREEDWRCDLPIYDLVVMAEVIEHLYTAPSLVLRFLGTIVRPGGLLVIQTPNAAALGKRIQLLRGHNPYERIREDRTRPGHFREYTGAELVHYLAGAGFAVEACHYRSYFDLRHPRGLGEGQAPGWGWRVKDLLYRIAPPRLRTGMTLVARRLPDTTAAPGGARP